MGRACGVRIEIQPTRQLLRAPDFDCLNSTSGAS
jgi:hypothetical protein